MVFIDGSNFYYGLKATTAHNTQVDFHKLGKCLAGDDRLVRVYYYNATVPETVDPERYRSQQRFFARVEATPYVIMRLGRLKPRGDTFVEKGVDVLIAVDMLRHAVRDNYDVAVLVSGDGDFAEAITAVTDMGRNVINASFRTLRSDALINVSDLFVELTLELIERCRPD